MVTEELDKKVTSMCNLSIGLAEEGFREGWERGRAEVRREYLPVVASLVRDGTLALQEAATRFGFTEQELANAL